MISALSNGGRTILPYSSAAIAAFVNSPNYIKSPSAVDFIKEFLGGGLVTAEYDEHRRQRRILTPAFAVGHIREIAPHFWFKTNQLVEYWEPLVENQGKEGIEVLQWMNRLALDIIGVAGFLFEK